MCNLTEGFILCTCSGKREKSDALFTWKLFRSRSSEPDVFVIGETSPPYNSKQRFILVDKIREQLNARNCFDFDYKPEEGDALVITQSDTGKEYAFTFKDGWEYEPMPFMGKTMLEIEKGNIK